MLLKPRRHAFDPTAQSVENFIADEKHTFNDPRSRYFAMRHGAYYTKSLTITDSLSGRTLIRDTDYRCVHMYLEPTSNTGFEVSVMVYVMNELVNDVSLAYQCVGGRYEDYYPVIDLLIKQFPDGGTGYIEWSNVLSLPLEFIPTAHLHDISNFDEWDQLVNSLTLVYAAILSKKSTKYSEIYSTLESKITDLKRRIELTIVGQENETTRLIARTQLGRGDYLFTDDANSPTNTLGYGIWESEIIGMLKGTVSDEEIGDIIPVDVANTQNRIAARKTHIFKRTETGDDVLVSLVRSTANINEGQSVTFSLVTAGMAGGKTFNYVITGVQENDIDKPLTGTIVTNSSGTGSITITTAVDNLTEGVETLRIKLLNYPVFASCTINDTSVAKTLDIGFYRNNTGAGNPVSLISEGETIQLIVRSLNIPTNTTYHLHYIFNNGMTINDIEGTLPSTLTIVNNLGRATLKIKSDYITEGTETLGVSISPDGNVANILTTTWVRVDDTSRSATYNLRFATDALGESTTETTPEGSKVYLVVGTTNVPDNSSFTLIYGGTVDSDDFIEPRVATVMVVKNKAIVPYTLKNDLLSEGTETFDVIMLKDGSAIANTTISIYDTSAGVEGNVGFSLLPGTFPVSTLTKVKEGDTVYLIFNLPVSQNGMVYNLVYEGGMGATDFTSVRPTTATISNGRASVRYEIKNDALNDGDKLFRVKVYEPVTNKLVATTQVTVVDTSTSPTFDIKFTNDQYASEEITSVAEGSLLYAIISTNNMSDGELIYLNWISGGLDATTATGDVTLNPVPYVAVQSGKAIVAINIASDRVTEGAETLKLDLRLINNRSAPVVGTRSITINDTSRTPSYGVKFTTMADGSGSVSGNTLLEGSTVYAVITTQNVPDGETLWIDYRGDAISMCDSTDFVGTMPTLAVIRNNKAIIAFKSKIDWEIDSTLVNWEEFRINLYSNSQMTLKVADAFVRFVDASISIRASGNSSGAGTIDTISEGGTVYVFIETTNVLDGTLLLTYATLAGHPMNVASNDLVSNIPTSVVINNNLASFNIKLANPTSITANAPMKLELRNPLDGNTLTLAKCELTVTKR